MGFCVDGSGGVGDFVGSGADKIVAAKYKITPSLYFAAFP